MAMSLRRVSGTQAGAVVVILAIVSQAISGDILYRQGGVRPLVVHWDLGFVRYRAPAVRLLAPGFRLASES